ncbi:golgin subfamily B member 1-like [Argopecten irradians]|uniref:golgin subfamily B member 1-like n=1 Tax=Argopecten irradians TaxID=31199 RepID=UPI00371CD548
MESCHSTLTYPGSALPPALKAGPVLPSSGARTSVVLSPCHPPVYSTLGHLITIIEELRKRQVKYTFGTDGEDVAKNALKKLLFDCEKHIDKMATSPTKSTLSGTNNFYPNPMIEELEIEMKKLQQTNDTNQQDLADQLKKIKSLEQKLKPSQEKNKKFLEKNMELTMQNRSLKDQIQVLNDENKKIKEQCEHSKKRVKSLSQQLSHEKMERGTAEIKAQDLDRCKTQITELTKTVTALRQTCIEKDRRIELIQHRKRRKRWLRTQAVDKSPGVKETFFGYDEDDTSVASVDSETSFSSVSHGTLSDEDLCEELSREEIEGQYQQLMKEHLELQRLHSLLLSQTGSHMDPQRENKLRTQLQSDLFTAQCKIEELQALLRQQDEEIHSNRNENKDLLAKNRSLEERNIHLEKAHSRLELEVTEAREVAENLEFRIVELESQETGDHRNEVYHVLETIPEDPAEMNDQKDGTLAPPYSRDGAESPEVMGQRLQEQEVHIKTLEQTASELQKKISSLQQEKSRLEDHGGSNKLSLEEREAQEVLKVKDSFTQNNLGCRELTHGNHGNGPICNLTDSNHNNQTTSNHHHNSNHSNHQTRPDQITEEDLGKTNHCLKSDKTFACGVTQTDDAKKENVPQDIGTNYDQMGTQTDLVEKRDVEVMTVPIKQKSKSPSPGRRSPSPDPQEQSPAELTNFNSHIIQLEQDLVKLRDQNLALRSLLQDNSSLDSSLLQEDEDSNGSETIETKMAELLVIFEALQERIYCYETTERQLKDRLKLMERNVNDLEVSEGSTRDQLEDAKRCETEARKSLANANHKVKELKEIILDKDSMETTLAEKVQFLEQAEVISSQKINELEQRNQSLQQRLDLKEELESDLLLVETLKERLQETQSENDELSIKLSEMEESEETLKINWMKVAENDANRIQSLEEKVKVLENSTRELKSRLREQQDRSPMPTSSEGPSLAMELTQSETSEITSMDQTDSSLLFRISSLEEELQTMKESKNAKIETLQEKICQLKENEIKLSETLGEMEIEERELRSRLKMYENRGSAKSEEVYVDKIKELSRSQHNLLDRLDSMEDHEESLKIRMQETESSLQRKIDQYEREIAQYMEQEEEMLCRVQEFEKHDDELMEKCKQYESQKSELEAEIETLNNQMDSYCEHERELIKAGETLNQENEKLSQDVKEYEIKTEKFEQQIAQMKLEKDALNAKVKDISSELKQVKVQCSELTQKQEWYSKELGQVRTENDELTEKLETVGAELDQVRSENDDLNERLIELDSSEQECLEKIRNIEIKNANIKHLEKKVDVLEEAEYRLMDRVSELEEIERSLRSRLEVVKTEQSTETTESYFPLSDSSGNEDVVTKIDSKPVVETKEQTTDTFDLGDASQGGKVTGLFQRLQELESENQSLSEKLVSLTATDAQVKQLSEKVRLLENSEDRLMDRVMELEEIEDRMKCQLAKAGKISGSSVEKSDTEIIEEASNKIQTGKNSPSRADEASPDRDEFVDALEEPDTSLMKRQLEKAKKSSEAIPDFDADMDSIEDADDSLREKINKMYMEKENLAGQMSKMEKLVASSKEKLAAVEKEMAEEKKKLTVSEKCLKEEKQKLSSSEKLLSESRRELDGCQKCLAEQTNKLSSLKSSEQKLLRTAEIEQIRSRELEKELLSTQEKLKDVQIESDLKISQYTEQVNQMVDQEKRLKQEVNDLLKGKEILSKQIDELQQQSHSQDQVISSQNSMQLKNQNLSNSANHASDSSHVTTYSSQVDNVGLKAKDNETDSKVLILVHKCQELESKYQEKCDLERKHVEKIQELERLCDSVDSRSSKRSVHGINELSPHDSGFMTDNEAGGHDLVGQSSQDQINAFHDVVKATVQDLETALSDNVDRTFPAISSPMSKGSSPFHTTLARLSRCKSCLLERLVNYNKIRSSLRTGDTGSDADLNQQINVLQSSEKRLQQRIHHLEQSKADLELKVRNATSERGFGAQDRNHVTSSSDGSRQDLLDRITALEQSEKHLKEKLQVVTGVPMTTVTMLDQPEDILRKRIGELERLEKHLKQQVLDMEQDREELHEIARKDKNLIHDQNVKLRELTLSEKNLKEQVNQFEASERSLYNKVEELEDQISRLEDRISELKVMEMRLKELVRKYKLDEEVWLSKSENLETSMTELSVSEAKMKKQVQSLETERNALAEKTEYLHLRLKELENAEANLIQRTKDQENKEIMLNEKLSELQTHGSSTDQQNSELQMVNVDLTQNFNHVVQENGALTHHIVQLQNQVQMLEQQAIALKDTELRLQQEAESLEKSEKELQKKVKDLQLKEVDTQGKLRQAEEEETILKDKLSKLQRSENKLKYRIQELENSGTQLPLDAPSSLKVPRKLEDCQRRLIILQNQNEKLKSRVLDYQNLSTSKSAVKLPLVEYQELQTKVALLEQTELHLDEMEQTNAQLLDTVKRMQEGQDVSSPELEAIQRRLAQSTKTIKAMRQNMHSVQWKDLGPVVHNGISADQAQVSHMEAPGRLAERGAKGQGQMTRSAKAGHPTQSPVQSDRYDVMNYDDMSDASTVDEGSVHKVEKTSVHIRLTKDGRFVVLGPHEAARGHKNVPNAQLISDDRQRMIDDLVSHLDSAENPLEEAHWKQVESLSPRAAGINRRDKRWVNVGKATSLNQSSAKSGSRLNPDEELVLGLTLPSESESQAKYSTQNDTDSTMASPLMKRRKFRPTESVDSEAPPPLPQSQPPSLNSTFNTADNFANAGFPGLEQEFPDEIMYEQDYHLVSAPTPHSMMSVPDSGHGTVSTFRSQALQDRISEISHALQKKPGVNSEVTDDEGVMIWKIKTSEALRQMENYDKENRYLKEEIAKLEKDLENKSRYILILERFLDTLSETLKLKDTRNSKEVIQIVEAELIKVREELADVGHKKLDLSQDVVALNMELNKRQRELVAKRNEADSLMRELRQWQEECRTIEDMRTNALDSLQCLQQEAEEIKELEKSLKHAKDENNKLLKQSKKLKGRIKDLEITVAENTRLTDQVSSLRSEVELIPQLEEDNSHLEEKLDECSKLLEDRSEKIKDLLREISDCKGKVVSLEQDNICLEKDIVGYDNVKAQFSQMKQTKEEAVLALVPLKSKVHRLSQKCKDKDELLRRLGEELRKFKGISKPVVLLEQLRHMEELMAGEEYNKPDEDLQRSSSVSSFNDVLDHGAWSDSELSPRNINGRPDQYDRHQRPLPSQQLPLIHRPNRLPVYSLEQQGHKQPPAGHMPRHPAYVAVADYDPSTFSKSGRPRLELQLTEGNTVTITGPLDSHGYYEAEVKGRVGLVPASHVQPESGIEDLGNLNPSPNERRIQQLQSTPSHLDPSPEKILNMHVQLQKSHQPHRYLPPKIISPKHGVHLNGHLPGNLSPRVQKNSQLSPQFKQGVPEPPTDLKAEKTAGGKSILLSWTPPKLNELAQSNRSQVIGYKIYMNGKVQQQVNSPHLSKAVVDTPDNGQSVRLGIQTLTTNGPVSVVKEISYRPDNKKEATEGEPEGEDLVHHLNSTDFRAGKRHMFLGVYDYDPSHQSPRENSSYELAFHAGDVITVYGRERPDGFYYGEINGRRGLVPASFMEEIPVNSAGVKLSPKSPTAYRGAVETKHTHQRT